jgi:hypothetical protein
MLLSAVKLKTSELLPVYKKIKEEPSLVRDTKTNAILNQNVDEYLAAKQRQNRYRREKSEIASLRSQVNELKSIVQTLINNRNAE